MKEVDRIKLSPEATETVRLYLAQIQNLQQRANELGQRCMSVVAQLVGMDPDFETQMLDVKEDGTMYLVILENEEVEE